MSTQERMRMSARLGRRNALLAAVSLAAASGAYANLQSSVCPQPKNPAYWMAYDYCMATIGAGNPPPRDNGFPGDIYDPRWPGAREDKPVPTAFCKIDPKTKKKVCRDPRLNDY